MPTGLIEYQQNQPTRYALVRDGITGNLDVLWRMIDLVRETVLFDKGFENLIKNLVVGKGYDAYTDPDAIFSLLYDFVKYGDAGFNGVAYLQDIKGRTESIKDARTTLQDGFGDCDDNAILTASMLAVLGYSPCFVIARYPESDSFQHVYTVVYLSDKRYVFDTTIENGHLNSEVDDMQTEEFCIFESRPETDGIPSVARNFKNLFTQTLRNAQVAAPVLSGLLPFGIIGNRAASMLFSGADDSSINELASRINGEMTDIIIQLQQGIITKVRAQAIIRKIYSGFHAINKDKVDLGTYNYLDKQLTKRISYVDNFTEGNQGNVEIHPNIKLYIGAAILGVSVIYLMNRQGLR